MKRCMLIVFGMFCLEGTLLWGEVNLPSIFSDNMVLQAGKPVPVWGTATPGEIVTVELSPVVARTLLFTRHEVVARAKAGADGVWRVSLARLYASDKAATLKVKGSASPELVATNVLVGEVWICSGQSNMEFPVARVINAEKEIAASANPLLRQFKVIKKTSVTPLAECAGKWELADTNTVGGFTAVGYFYGRDLQAALKVPVALIHASWGGTPAEAWTSRAGLESDPDLKALMESQLANLAKVDAKADPKKQPRLQNTSTCLYNSMINPLIPYAVAGAIWYQGESNAGRAVQYRRLFPTLITNWRTLWNQGDFPFYFCQLANFMAKETNPVESAWAELREAQTLTLKLPHTGQAVLIDIGEAADIHPRNKQEVGSRLALVSLSKTYGRKVEFSGPVYKSIKVIGSKARISFSNLGGGLVAGVIPATYQPKSLEPETKPLERNSPGSQLEGFAICGTDKVWVWADAVIEGNTVVVSSPRVAEPVAVRYAWANNPTCNLLNKTGLPAGPFRTDNFPAITGKAK